MKKIDREGKLRFSPFFDEDENYHTPFFIHISNLFEGKLIAKKKREDKILNFKSRNIYIYMYHRQYRQFCTKRASFYFFFSLNRIIHNISTTSIPLFQTSIANSFHRHHFSLHKRNFLPTKRPSIVLCKFISCKFPNIYIHISKTITNNIIPLQSESRHIYNFHERIFNPKFV